MAIREVPGRIGNGTRSWSAISPRLTLSALSRRSGLSALAILCSVLLLGGCGSDPVTSTKNTGGKKSGSGEMRVLCSVYPVYLFAKNVVGDTAGVNVSLMLPASQGCPHGYDLSTTDGKRIANADVLVLNGGGLESFTETKIRSYNVDILLVDSCKGLKLLDAECEHDHSEEGHGHDHHHHAEGKNPHCFTSPILAAKQTKNIAEALAAADPKRGDIYRKNGADYAAKLEALAAEFKTRLAKATNRKIVCSHEIFAYLAVDADLKVVGEVQSGDGKDTTPKKLIELIKKEKPKVIFTEPQYNSKTAKMIAQETGLEVHQLDPLATGPDEPKADHYEKTMRANLDILVKVLGGA